MYGNMSNCPVCGAEYIEEKAEFCSICGWDLTPYPQRAKASKTYLTKEQVRLQWAKQMWELARNQQNWSAKLDELQGELQQGAIARTYIQSQLEWVLYRLEQLNPEFIVSTLLRLEDKIGAIPDKTPAISEVGMDYRQLTKLLETGKWRKADEHTWEILLQIAVREDEGWLSSADIDSFPPTDLRTIDQLWQQYSSGRFGLSVQQQIWESSGENYTEFCDIAKFCIIFPATFPNLLLHAQPEPPAAVLLPKLVDRAKVCRRKTVNIGRAQPAFVFPDSDLQQDFPSVFVSFAPFSRF